MSLGFLQVDGRVVRAYVVCAVVLWAHSASAIGEVSSPNITKDKLAVEYGVVRSFDAAHDKDKMLSHELELKYGIANRLRYEVKLELEDKRDKSVSVDAVEFGAQYQMFERGENWLDSAIKLSYAHKPHNADAIKAKLLLEKKHGGFTHRSNISLAQDVGHGAETGGPEWTFQWSSRYAVMEQLALGFEIDSDPGRIQDFDDRHAQQHYAGPSAYGKISDEWGYEAAYFFGLNDNAANGAALFILEYGVKF